MAFIRHHSSTNRHFNIFRLVASLLFISLTTLPAQAFASSTDHNSWVNTSSVEGVDVVLVEDQYSPDAMYTINEGRFFQITGYQIRPWIMGVVGDIFSSQPSVSIYPHNEAPPDLNKRNYILLTFVLSARDDTIDGKPVKVADLSVAFTRIGSDRSSIKLGPLPVAYPFIVPDSKDELGKRIAEAVRFLISPLPYYFCLRDPKAVPCTDIPSPYMPMHVSGDKP